MCTADQIRHSLSIAAWTATQLSPGLWQKTAVTTSSRVCVCASMCKRRLMAAMDSKSMNTTFSTEELPQQRRLIQPRCIKHSKIPGSVLDGGWKKARKQGKGCFCRGNIGKPKPPKVNRFLHVAGMREAYVEPRLMCGEADAGIHKSNTPCQRTYAIP